MHFFSKGKHIRKLFAMINIISEKKQIKTFLQKEVCFKIDFKVETKKKLMLINL